MFIAFVPLLATSCNNSFKVKVDDIEIPGGYAPYLELVPGKYKVEKAKFGNKDAMTINLTLLTKREGNFEDSGFDNLFFKLYDKKRNEIIGIPEFWYNCAGGGTMDVITRAVNNNSGYVYIRIYCDGGFKKAKSSAKYLRATDSKAENAPKIVDCDLFENETQGFIGDREIRMTLHNGKEIKGEVYYVDEGPTKKYKLTQEYWRDFDGQNLVMSLSDMAMRSKGVFRGTIDSESYTGIFTYNKEEYDFAVGRRILQEAEQKNTIEEIQESVSTNEQPIVQTAVQQENISSVSSETDWDTILDEYEQYVDKYISFLKKVSNGDYSAMVEYAEYMEKAMSVSDKLANAKDEMTSAQIARYMKILNKMTTEAAKLSK